MSGHPPGLVSGSAIPRPTQPTEERKGRGQAVSVGWKLMNLDKSLSRTFRTFLQSRNWAAPDRIPPIQAKKATGEISCDQSSCIPSKLSRTSIDCVDYDKSWPASGGDVGVSATCIVGVAWSRADSGLAWLVILTLIFLRPHPSIPTCISRPAAVSR